jgi:hypothetical protein
LAFGAIIAASGLYDGTPSLVVSGASLLGAGVGLMAISAIISLLKQIRDSLTRPQ